MPPPIDITGQRFGKVVALGRDGHIGKQAAWLLKCDCGGYIRGITGGIRAGLYRSCGCSRSTCGSEPRQLRRPRHRTRLYTIWRGMKARCSDKNRREFPDYGGRGIAVCREWADDFIVFRNWALANGYRDDLTIDREDVDGNYEPGNCRWATRLVQNRNTRWHKERGADVTCPKALPEL